MEPTNGREKACPVVPVPTLWVAGGPLAGTVFRLEADSGTAGRREDNTYVVADPTVSRLHARLTREAGSVVVADLGSTGGTRINGEVLEAARVLCHGDRVSFAAVDTRFENLRQLLFTEAATGELESPAAEGDPQLSPRQLQVLGLMAEGLTNRQIGGELGIGERTVKTYAGEIYTQLDASNRANAVAAGLDHGLL